MESIAKPFLDMAVNYALAHREFVYGAACAWALSHVALAVRFLFGLAMKLPWLRALVVGNPDQAKQVIDEAATELKADIDAEAAAKAQAVPPSAPATGPPPAK